MKHALKITLLLLTMFFGAQIIGLYVSSFYAPVQVTQYNQTLGTLENHTTYNIPYGLAPPEEIEPTTSVISIITALFLAVGVMFLLMKLKAETFLRAWFFLVIIIGIALSLNALLNPLAYASLMALIIAAPLAYLKVFKRNLYVHNATELIIYPGIASVFIPLLSIPSIIILLLLISAYDMYAVWHAGFMQKMAKYQIEKLRVFSGFFIPYRGKQARIALNKTQAAGKKASQQVHVAILGGGDIVFPIITSGVVLHVWGLVPALFVSIFATLALAALFYVSKKGKFYPAMPFITIGCFIGLALGYLIH